MEVARAAMETRARATKSASTIRKKRKVNNTNGRQPAVELSPSSAQLKKPRRGVNVSSSASKIESAKSVVREVLDDDVSTTSDHAESSCCSSNGSSELVHERNIKFVDLEDESDQVEIESSMCNSRRERNEMTAPNSSERQASDSEEVESTVVRSNKEAAESGRRSPTPPKNPAMEAGLEEFFASFEKEEHKRFLEKYNYDIVKDEPVEGRYEWVRLKP